MKLKCSITISCFIFLFSISCYLETKRDKNNLLNANELALLEYFKEKRNTNDPSNRHLKSKTAILLGRYIFSSNEISRNKLSCQSCHLPSLAFCDTLRTSNSSLRRNTPSLFNSSLNRWFFWDGRADSHWSQALEPLENINEMGSPRSFLLARFHQIAQLKQLYEDAFGVLPNVYHTDSSKLNYFFSNLGKALAAYQNTLISNNSKFDRFLKDVLDNGDSDIFSQDEVHGLKLFIGKAKCITCHNGFNFTDNEFHNIKLKQDDKMLDPGRYDGIELVRQNQFNRLSKYSDDSKDNLVSFLLKESKNWGEFKTPSLRNVELTYPYMHDGRFKHLDDVVNYYSTLDGSQKNDHHSEIILNPLGLTKYEKSSLISFLKTLTDTTSYKNFPLY